MLTTGTMTIEGSQRSLLRLMTWLSPAFPVGGFAYSGGLERAVQEGHVGDAATLKEWLNTALRHGALWTDAVLLAEAWHAGGPGDRLAETADLARALAGSAERYVEITAQGDAFLAAAAPWCAPTLAPLDRDMPYCVAVGMVASLGGVALHEALVAWLHAATSQLVSAAIRLGVLGQRDAMALLAQVEPALLETALAAEASTIDDIGSATVIADIMSARHELPSTRLFRS